MLDEEWRGQHVSCKVFCTIYRDVSTFGNYRASIIIHACFCNANHRASHSQIWQGPACNNCPKWRCVALVANSRISGWGTRIMRIILIHGPWVNFVVIATYCNIVSSTFNSKKTPRQWGRKREDGHKSPRLRCFIMFDTYLVKVWSSFMYINIHHGVARLNEMANWNLKAVFFKDRFFGGPVLFCFVFVSISQFSKSGSTSMLPAAAPCRQFLIGFSPEDLRFSCGTICYCVSRHHRDGTRHTVESCEEFLCSKPFGSKPIFISGGPHLQADGSGISTSIVETSKEKLRNDMEKKRLRKLSKHGNFCKKM